MRVRDEVAKYMYGILQRKKRKIKRSIYESKKEVNERFGRKMNQDIDVNRKLFWKEGS